MSPCISSNSSSLAASTFFAKSHPTDVCGSNGLPLTANSIAILGRAQILKTIIHENLCQYLGFIRAKHERTIIVSEYFGKSLREISRLPTPTEILKIIYQIILGLIEIQNHGFVVHNLEPKNILVDDNFNVKLFNYGLYHMTKQGEYVTFPIGNVRYLSPERLAGAKGNIKSDIWSLGIIASELFLECDLWPTLKISSTVRKICTLCNTKNVFEKIAREHNCFEKYQNLPKNIRDFVEKCLSISVKIRPLPSDLINFDIFTKDLSTLKFTNTQKSKNILFQCPRDQIYYLWQLAGGDVQADLKKNGLIKSEAPILSIPKIVCLNGIVKGYKRSQCSLMGNRIVILNPSNLTERLKNVPIMAHFPLIHSSKFTIRYGTGLEQLPLVIREKNTEYQFYRVKLFSRLIQGYPYTRDHIIKEAHTDIPPLLRGKIWSCLLDVIENGYYQKIDKFTPNTTDRQIEVDIPRCHQYDELLSSPEGHKKLKRLLKAWVTSHPQYVYWQGLDSLTAPFLYLNFNNEELAFLSLYNFIPKYLHWFFLKDNSAVIKEYLCKFSQLTAYHEPYLAKHLSGINFIPELYAIPWFLTMFSHVFPLHKIIHLWDKLILGDSSYPLFIGISVLKQLKTTLLNSGFNECILLFSDLPDIVMETCVTESQKMYLSTPKSICHREHLLIQNDLNELDINNVTLSELQEEICPRISAKDFAQLITNSKNNIIVIDIRGSIEFNKAHIKSSINIPFNSVQLGNIKLESLNIPNLEVLIKDKIIVVIGTVHENSILFSKYLFNCGVGKVCVLHKGFSIIQSLLPNIIKVF